MYSKRFYSVFILVVFIIFCNNTVIAQTTIPYDYRGTLKAIERGVLDGNQIETNFRNHGEMSRWNDIPWGIWPKGTGGPNIDGIGFVMAGRVVGEKAKWADYYGVGAKDTVLNPVIITYRQAGIRTSPYSGDLWGWLPLPGFNNPFRIDPITLASAPVPALSNDTESWPEFWPDRLSETLDAGWEGSWNGFRGKGLVTGHQETFYVMDDFSDKEYAFGEEIDGPHSTHGVYYPSPSDSTIGGLGLQTEVRTFQFNDVLAKDMLFTQYRTTNVSEKDITETWTSIIIDAGLGNDQNDDNLKFNQDLELFIFWDSDGIGNPSQVGQTPWDLGYAGFMILEHSIKEDNGIDEDGDGIIDESKFNGPGELIIGKAAIDLYLADNYDMELFEKSFVELAELPAYQQERWWTGDEDLDWIAYDDLNGNGIQDENEELLDDIGRDGLGPNDANYTGPDEGEGDGIPTQGEPNFGEQDMLEAENRGLGNFDLNVRPFYESGDNLRDDSWLFSRIDNGSFEDDILDEDVLNEDPFLLVGSDSFPLMVKTSSYFTTVLIFGEDEEDLLLKAERARVIYESDYGQTVLITGNEDEIFGEVPTQVFLSQNYPNPFNPSTNIEFSLSRSTPVSLKIFDVTGREIASLINEKRYSSGKHSIQFNADGLASGIYFYQLIVNGEILTKKLTLIK